MAAWAIPLLKRWLTSSNTIFLRLTSHRDVASTVAQTKLVMLCWNRARFSFPSPASACAVAGCMAPLNQPAPPQAPKARPKWLANQNRSDLRVYTRTRSGLALGPGE